MWPRVQGKSTEASVVANDGYTAMLTGKLVELTGLLLWQRVLFWVMPFIPRRVLLRQVKAMQEVR